MSWGKCPTLSGNDAVRSLFRVRKLESFPFDDGRCNGTFMVDRRRRPLLLITLMASAFSPGATPVVWGLQVQLLAVNETD